MYALVEWVDEQKFSVIPLSKVKEPRKSFAEYQQNDLVKAACPGFPGVHNARLIEMRAGSAESKKELEQLATEHIQNLISSEDDSNDDEEMITSTDRNEKTPANKKRRRSANDEKEKAKKDKPSTTKVSEKEQRKEEQQKKKEQTLRKNEAFLAAIDAFKESTTEAEESDEVETLLDLDNQDIFNKNSNNVVPSMPVNAQEQYHQQFSYGSWQGPPPASMTTWQTPSFPQFIDSYQHPTPPPPSFIPSLVKEPCRECANLREQLKEAQKRAESLEIRLNERQGQTTYRQQTDGKPRAGVLPTEVAREHFMIELIPGSKVFVYPKDLRTATKKHGGQKKARFLLSVFYTNQELVEAGNIFGANGKPGLDRAIVEAINAYSILNTDDKPHEIATALRSKVSALVCKYKGKPVADH